MFCYLGNETKDKSGKGRQEERESVILNLKTKHTLSQLPNCAVVLPLKKKEPCINADCVRQLIYIVKEQ